MVPATLTPPGAVYETMTLVFPARIPVRPLQVVAGPIDNAAPIFRDEVQCVCVFSNMSH